MYLTLEPTGLNVEFETLQLHVLSADTSLGANVFSSFASADVVNVDGKQYAELKQIVLEPVYTAKLYFDSLFVEIDEKMNEFAGLIAKIGLSLNEFNSYFNKK